jgi:hypothetical protein
MADDNAVVKITIDATGAKKGADEFRTAGASVVSTNQSIEQSENKTTATVVDAAAKRTAARKAAAASQGSNGEVAAAAAQADVFGKATDRVVISLAKQRQILAETARAVDPLGVALEKAQTRVENLNKVIATGGPNAEQATGRLAAAQKLVADAQIAVSLAANDNSSALGKAGKAAGDAAEAHRNLSTQGMEAFHVLRSMAEQAAIGTPPIQLLTQHIGQLSYAASGPGGLKGALGEVTVLLRGFVGPGALAVGTLALVAGAIALIGARALSIDDNIRKFSVTLRAMGTDAQLSGKQAQGYLEDLEHLGIGADEAKKALVAIFTTSGVNPAFARDIVALGHDIAAAFGGDTTSRAQELNGAITGGVEGLIKFGAQFNKFTADEIINLRATGSVADAFALLKARIPPAADSISRAELAALALSQAWNKTLNALAESNFAKDAIAGLDGLVAKIKAVLDQLDGVYNWFKDHQDFIGKGIDKLTGGGLINQLPSPAAAAGNAQAARDDLAQALRERGASDAEIQAVTNSGPPQLTTGTAYDAVIRSLIQTESGGNPNAVSPAGAIGLTQLMPGTARGLGVNPWDPAQNVAGGSQYLMQLTQRFGNLQSGLQAYNWGPGNYQQYLAGNKTLPASVQNYSAGIIGRVAGVTGQETAGQLTNATALQAADTEKLAKGYSDALTALRLWGVEQQAEEARTRALNKAIEDGVDGEDRVRRVLDAVADVRDRAAAEIGKAATLAEMEAAGQLKTADAYRQSEAAGLRDAAMQQARIAGLTTGVSVQAKYTELLRAGAVAAINAAQQQSTAFKATLAASTRLVDAAKLGTAAEHDAELQNEAVARTHDAVTKAIATGDQALIERAQKLEDETAAQLKANAALQQTLQLEQATNNLKDNAASLQLEIALQGQNTGEIQRQLDLLAAKQKIENDSSLATDEAKRNYLAQVDAVGQLRGKLQEAQAAQSNINGAISNIAGTIDTTLTTAIGDAFDGKKIDDWGARIKSVLKSVVTQLADALFIKPLLGSVAGALGFPQVGQQLGTFGGLGGLFGGTTTTNTQNVENVIVAGSGQVANETSANPFLVPGTETPLAGSTTSSTFSFGNIAGAASLGKTAFDLGGTSSAGLTLGADGLFTGSGIGGSINAFGANNLGTFAGGSFAPGEGLFGTGLLGTTTLTSALTGVGAGFGAGALVNSLVGGNTTNGLIGSGVGAIAGTLLGSLIDFPILGGILGGLGGGTFGGPMGRDTTTIRTGRISYDRLRHRPAPRSRADRERLAGLRHRAAADAARLRRKDHPGPAPACGPVRARRAFGSGHCGRAAADRIRVA